MIYKCFAYIPIAASIDFDKSAKIANIMFYVFLVLALLALACGIFCFIRFNIPRIIGDLSGRTARKSIAQMREENEKSGKKSHRPHPVASDRGTLTEPIKQNNTDLKKQKQSQKNKKTTPTLNTLGSEQTDILDNSNATERLDYDETGTETLADGTQVLSNEQIQIALNQKTEDLKMIQDIVLIHTEEVI